MRNGTRWRAARGLLIRGRSSLTPRGRCAAAPHDRAYIHAHLKPGCKGLPRYISALLHCEKMGPKGGSERAFSAETILALVVLFSRQGTGGGRLANNPAPGNSPARGVPGGANPRGTPAIPAATA